MFDSFPTGDSFVYQMWLSEKQEIERLKWLESERAGKDIGYDHAFWIWNMTHRRIWVKEFKEKHK